LARVPVRAVVVALLTARLRRQATAATAEHPAVVAAVVARALIP
jgi:hypothetical protein